MYTKQQNEHCSDRLFLDNVIIVQLSLFARISAQIKLSDYTKCYKKEHLEKGIISG